MIARLALVFVLSGCAKQAQVEPVDTRPVRDWWRDDVFYEIYPRSFADSNGDGTGDLAGITARLDDLRALGVDGLWLTPIHPTPSHHGYDVLDYEGVAPDLGTIADVEKLTAEAHARGMHVILDFVLNHSSVKHPWFTERPDFYIWRDGPDDTMKRPWDGAPVFHKDETTRRYYLGLFWSGMPDLNLENPAVVDAMIKAMRFWLDRGVDGFRIDAARHLVETAERMTDTDGTHRVMKHIRDEVLRTHPRALFVAEAWTDSTNIGAYTNEFDLVFSFGVAGGLVEALKNEERAPLVEALQGAEAAFRDRGSEAPFLTNHDMVRVMRQIGGDVERAKLGAAALMSLPGTPFLYYGEEVGMQGLEGRDDAFKRTTMEWDQWGNELWKTYRELIAFRRKHVRGDAVRPEVSGGGRGAFALLRGGEILFVANFAKDEAKDFNVEIGKGEVMLGDVEIVDGQIKRMKPHAYAFIRVR